MFARIVIVPALMFGLAAAAEAGLIIKTNNTGDASVDNEFITRSVNVLSADLMGDTPTILDVNIAITFSKTSSAPGFTAPEYQQIEFALQSPNGTIVTLVSNGNEGTEWVPADNFVTFGSGLANSSFSGTLEFDDGALVEVNAGPLFAQPVPGTYRPDSRATNQLTDYVGESALGTWTLFIEDSVPQAPLAFTSFTLTITTQAVPEPGSLALGGIVAVGLAVGIRRRQRQSPPTV